MRKRAVCVPMMTLCLLLGGCGGTTEGPDAAEAARAGYQTMERCSMTAEVTCAFSDREDVFTLKCDYVPEGETTVEVLAPESAAGVKAVLAEGGLSLVYEEDCLPAGTLSGEEISPAACLPRLMSALRDGWLLEQNREQWGEEDCLRLQLDQSGERGGKVISTLWLRETDHTPVRGEVSVGGEIILQAEFTDFQFGAILDGDGETAAD